MSWSSILVVIFIISDFCFSLGKIFILWLRVAQAESFSNRKGLVLNLHWICFCDFYPFLLLLAYIMACLREVT